MIAHSHQDQNESNNSQTNDPPIACSIPINLTKIPGILTLRELFETPKEDQQWLVADLLILGGVSILVGKPKAGKSTLARFLAFCVSKGEHFLDRTTSGSRVIYLAIEEVGWQMSEQFQKMGADGSEPIWIHCGLWTGGIARLRQLIERIKPSLVIIDPLFRFIRCSDACDYVAVLNSLEPVFSIARQTGTHVMLVHHATKARKDGADQILGSTAIFGTVDAALVLERNEGLSKISSFQRYGSEIPPTSLTFDRDTFSFVVEGRIADKKVETLEQAILEFIGQQGPSTEIDILSNIEGRITYKRNALKNLNQRGIIEKTGQGVRGAPFLYRKK